MRESRIMMIPLFLVVLFAMSFSLDAAPAVSKIDDTIVDDSAVTIDSYGQAINGLSFQQSPVITHNGWQYVAYYHGVSGGSVNGYVCVARRKLSGDIGFQVSAQADQPQTMFSMTYSVKDWDIISLPDYIFSNNDAHNVVSMGICPNDGTIHLSFDHHGNTLHYRKSIPGIASDPLTVKWDASLFGTVQNYLIVGQTVNAVTYPRFWQTPSGDMQMGYRTGSSGNGDWYIADYSGSSGLWSNIRMVISRSGTYSDSVFSNSTSRNPYMNVPGYSSDGKLQVTWTWRESASDANHDIMYAYSDDNGYTWYNTFGNQIADTTRNQTISLNSPGIKIVTLDTNRGVINQQTQAFDHLGRVHVVMFYCNSARDGGTFGRISQRRYFHHWRELDGTWHSNELEFDTQNIGTWVGSRPQIYIDSQGNAFVIYQSWQNAGIAGTGIYIRYGNLSIQAATAANNYNDWNLIHVENGPFVSEAIADPYQLQNGVLSVMMQGSPSTLFELTPLHILDYELK